MLGAEYTVIKRGKNIITLNYLYFVWGCHRNVKALCFKAIILGPNPVLALFLKIRVLNQCGC